MPRLALVQTRAGQRFAARQLFLVGLGLPGNELLPAHGRLRWAADKCYVAVAVVALLVLR